MENPKDRQVREMLRAWDADRQAARHNWLAMVGILAMVAVITAIAVSITLCILFGRCPVA